MSQLLLEDDQGSQVAEHAVERGRIYSQNLKPPLIDLIQQPSANARHSEESKEEESNASKDSSNSPDIVDYFDLAF